MSASSRRAQVNQYTGKRVAGMSHTLGVVEYWGKGLDIFILRNGCEVGPLRPFRIQDVLCRVSSRWCSRHDGRVEDGYARDMEFRHRCVKTIVLFKRTMHNRKASLGKILDGQ